MSEELRAVARRYYDAGLNVLPAIKAQKRPVGAWKRWTTERPDFDAVFRPGLAFDAICVVCGATSGGLEILDFDQKAVKFDAFVDLLTPEKCERPTGADSNARAVARIKAVFDGPVETTQSGGKHLAFRSDCCGKNQKLANNASGVTIETRGEGGICLIAPSPGYELISGDWLNVPVVGGDVRDRLMNAARSLNESKPPTGKVPNSPRPSRNPAPIGSESVADYLRGNLQIVRDALTRKGWEYLRDEGDFEQWSRPNQQVVGKMGGSLNVKEKYFYCFTSNAPPFEPNKCYSPLEVVALLDFKGDVSEASRAFARPRARRNVVVDAYDPFIESAPTVQTVQTKTRRKTDVEFPRELLEDVGGMIGEIQAQMNRLAIRPQPEGAFLGAFCTSSYLVGRSIALNYSGTLVTPNVYGLFLAPTGMGKEAIRRVASEVARCYAPGETTPESFASVQALQNLLSRRQKLFWLHDEFGRDLAVMTGEKNNVNVTGIITESLKLYSNANNRAYLPKVVAQEAKGAKKIEPVDRPYLTIFATGNPSEYYDATTDALLRNGYVARFTTVLGRKYSEKKTTTFEEATGSAPFELTKDFQSRIFDWKKFEMSASGGPFLVPFEKRAFERICDFDATIERQIRVESVSNETLAGARARYFEKVWKYALNFGASRYGPTQEMRVDDDCARLATLLVDYESRLFAQSAERFAGNMTTRLALDVRDWAETVGGSFTQTDFTRKFQRRGGRRDRQEVLDNLIDAEYLRFDETTRRFYLL